MAWIAKIRESMARLTPHFSSNRTVREYTEKFYLPAAEIYRKRAENNGALARQIVDWRALIEQNWGKLGFGEVKIETWIALFEVQVYLNDLDRQAVKVELYSATHDKRNGISGMIPNTPNGHIYRAEVPAANPASSFTARISTLFSRRCHSTRNPSNPMANVKPLYI